MLGAEVEVTEEGAEAAEQLEHQSAHHRCRYQVRCRSTVGPTLHVTTIQLGAERQVQGIDSTPLSRINLVAPPHREVGLQ